MPRSSLTYIFLFVLMALSHQAMSAPMASVDRSVIAIDDSLTLTLRINRTGSFNSPDLSPLDADFHILGSSQSSRHMISNGQSESLTEWTISLMPKRQGELTIPAISIDGQQSQPITINVQPSVPRSAGNLQPVFLESEVDQDSVYVQQQLIFTLRIFQSIQLDNMNISEPEFDNAAIEKLGQTSFQRRIQNTPYRVHELRYAIFPQQSGELIIPELVFTASETVSRRSVFALPGQGRPIRKMSQQHTIEVKAPPQNFSGSQWLPARSIKIMETWSSSPGNIHVGESITRTITVKAEGLLASQLAPLQFPALDGAKFYPDQGKTETSVSDQDVLSSRSDSVAIIPTQAGELKLPEVRIQWWDTENNQLQQAVIPASSLRVKPAAGNNLSTSTPLAVDHSQPTATVQSTPAITVSGDHTLWKILTLLFALSWLITLIMWWRLKKTINKTVYNDEKNSSSISEQQAFKTLTRICRDNDLNQARQAIIDWGRSHWPEQNIQSLQDIQQHCQHPSLTAALLQLDHCLYGRSPDSSGWNGENLLSIIKLIRQDDKQTNCNAEGLKPLYNN
jgi:hypothetical protein